MFSWLLYVNSLGITDWHFFTELKLERRVAILWMPGRTVLNSEIQKSSLRLYWPSQEEFTLQA